MGGSDRGLVLGFLMVLGISMIPVAVFWSLLHARDIREWLARAARRLRLVRDPAPEPVGPPIERLAGDIRRLARTIRESDRYTSQVRRRGLMMAYDDLLAAACRELEVPQRLREAPEGLDREAERLRVESCLEAAGLYIQRTRDDA